MISYVVGLTFLLLPFVSSKLSYDNFEYPKIIVFILVINLIMALKFWLVVHNPKKYLNFNLIDKSLLILLIWLLICWGVNGFQSISFWGQYFRYEGLITLITYINFYFLISRFVETRIVNWFIVFSGIIVSLYITVWGILFYIFNQPLYTFYGRITASFGNPNFAAGFLVLSFPFLLYYPKIKLRWKILITLIFLIALWFTQSRSGFLAFFTIMLLFLIKKFKHGFILVIPIFIVAITILFKVIPRYSSFNNQYIIWQKAVIAISKKPIFGWGMERFDIAFQKTLIPNIDYDLYHIKVDKTHNEILEYGISGGAPAMILYISLLMVCLVNLLKQNQSLEYWKNISVFLCFIILSQLNVLNITEYMFLYLILATSKKIN